MSETANVHSQYTDEYNKFLTGKANDVIDFKNRGVIAGNLLSKSASMQDIFSHVESSILPSVHLDSMAYDDDSKTLTLLCVTDTFDSEARQIQSFQNNAYFSLTLGKSVTDNKTGLMNFTVNLKIKSNKS